MQHPDPVEIRADAPALQVVPPPKYQWYHKVSAVMAAIFCFEIGVFLLLYPWISDWQPNALLFPLWARLAFPQPPFADGQGEQSRIGQQRRIPPQRAEERAGVTRLQGSEYVFHCMRIFHSP